MAAKRIDLLTVPVDIIQNEELEEKILAMLAEPSAKQIVFLSVWDLLRARINAEYLVALRNADLVLPISKSIIKGAKFLKLPIPKRYNPFDAVIKVLGILDRHYKSVFLFGAHKKSLMTAEKNVHFTFPGLKIVGRYVGYYPKDAEKNITQAIFKASPSLVLIGSGIKKGVLWVHRRRNVFNNSIFLWYSDVIDIFSSRKKRISPKVFEKGLEIWPAILKNPLRIFLIFPFIWFKLLLLGYKISGKSKQQLNEENVLSENEENSKNENTPAKSGE